MNGPVGSAEESAISATAPRRRRNGKVPLSAPSSPRMYSPQYLTGQRFAPGT